MADGREAVGRAKDEAPIVDGSCLIACEECSIVGGAGHIVKDETCRARGGSDIVSEEVAIVREEKAI